MNSPAPRRGLTLIELMIGLGIVAVLSAMAAPSLGNWLARQRTKAAAMNLVADLADARHEAARLHKVLRVNFEPGSQWCYVITTDPTLGCAAEGAAVLKRVRSTEHPGVVLGAAAPIDLHGSPDRLQAMAQVPLASAHGEPLRVKLSMLGRASVCAPAGGYTGVPSC